MSARLPRLRLGLAPRDARGSTGRPDRRVAAEVASRIATVLIALLALVVAAALAPEAAGSPPAGRSPPHAVVAPTP